MKRVKLRLLFILTVTMSRLSVSSEERTSAGLAPGTSPLLMNDGSFGVGSVVAGASIDPGAARSDPTELGSDGIGHEEDSTADIDYSELRAVVRILDLMDDSGLAPSRMSEETSANLLLSFLDGVVPGLLGGPLNLHSKDRASVLTDLFGDRRTPGIPAWLRALSEGRNSSLDEDGRQSVVELFTGRDRQSVRQTLLAAIFPNVQEGLRSFDLNSNSSIEDILDAVADNEELTSSLSATARELLRLVVRDAELMLLSQQFPVEPGTQCASDLREFATGLMERQLWSLKMLDASGKIPSGILTGYLTIEGNYVECIRVSQAVTESHSINGKFCGLTLHNAALMNKIESFGHLVKYQLNPLRLHVCLPASCTEDNIVGLMTPSVASLRTEIVDIDCYHEKDPSQNSWFFVAIICIAILNLLCVIGTAYGVFVDLKEKGESVQEEPSVKTSGHLNGEKHHEISHQDPDTNNGVLGGHGNASDAVKIDVNINVDSRKNAETTHIAVIENLRNEKASSTNCHVGSDKPRNNGTVSAPVPSTEEGMFHRLLLCFSVLRNGRKLLDCKVSPSDISCLHGIRFLSISWVIFGHAYTWIKETRGNSDYRAIIAESISNQVVYSAVLSVDTFFLLSGTLTSLVFLRSTQKSGVTPIGIAVYYLHRYVRLTPVYLLVLIYYMGIFPYTKRGPYQNLVGTSSEGACPEYWWQNILYVSNLFQGGSDNTCLKWSWYLANDMQFSFLAPLVLIPWTLRGSRKRIGLIVGHTVAVALMLVHIISTAYISYTEELSHTGDEATYHREIYIVPWCRVGPYALGLVFGFIVFKSRDRVKMGKVSVVLGWVVSWTVALLCAYSNYTNLNDVLNVGLKWSTLEMAVYEALAKVGWALCVAWVVFCCHNGYGGFINTLLSWKVFVPLSRLTYGAYLIHLIVLYTIHGNYVKLFYLDSWTVMEQFLCLLVLSFMASFIMAMLVEVPTMLLEKILLGKIFRRNK